MIDYSKLLKLIRKELIISQTDLANLLGVSFASVNRWENKKTEPTLSAKRAIKTLCNKYNIHMEETENDNSKKE